MEIDVKKQNKHVIAIVQDGSIAQELELVPGDILLTVTVSLWKIYLTTDI